MGLKAKLRTRRHEQWLRAGRRAERVESLNRHLFPDAVGYPRPSAAESGRARKPLRISGCH